MLREPGTSCGVTAESAGAGPEPSSCVFKVLSGDRAHGRSGTASQQARLHPASSQEDQDAHGVKAGAPRQAGQHTAAGQCCSGRHWRWPDLVWGTSRAC